MLISILKNMMNPEGKERPELVEYDAVHQLK